jgi:hypothetical protein
MRQPQFGTSRAEGFHWLCLSFVDQFTEIKNMFEDIPALLVKKAEGLFIYVATLCRFVKNNSQWPLQDLLDLFIPSDNESKPRKKQCKPPRKPPTRELDKIYTQILEHAFKR